MNASSPTTTVLRSRPGTDPVFGQFGGLLRTTLRSLRLQWFLYRAGRRKKMRVPESVGEMNAHMLRDIGAPDEMVARAAAAKPAHERSGIPFGLWTLLVAAVVIGTSTPTSAGGAAATAANGQVPAQVRMQLGRPAKTAGVFAGDYVNGAPVYRFPAVVVSGSRKDSSTGSLQPCRQARAAGLKSPA